MSDYTYVGTELDLFAAATVWKSYVHRCIRPYLGADVLEVGAGFGGTTRLLCRGDERRWVCLEPDPVLSARTAHSIAAGDLPACCVPIVGTLETQPDLSGFDSVLYMDVLEHIEHDRDELTRAAGRLRQGGHLVVLSPAHPWLFTPFDRAIGHFRRYTRASLRALAPEGCRLVRVGYLDSVGLLASLGNRLVLRSSLPTPAQIALWDKVLVRISTLLDPFFAGRLGKSVLGIWRRGPDSAT